MASFAKANLPSSDEEDDDYDPSKDPTGEKETGDGGGTAAKGRKRRGSGGAAAEGEAGEPGSEAADDPLAVTPAQAAKRARIGEMWERLHQASTGSVNKLSRADISLASLCSSVDPKRRSNTDLLWMRPLGITPQRKAAADPGSAPAAAAAAAGADAGPAAAGDAAAPAPADGQPQDGQQQQQQPAPAEPSPAIRAAAAAALAAAREAASGGVGSSYNKVTVVETRRFAGKDIQVSLQVDKDSKEARRAAERAAAAAANASGLDSFLRQIEAKKKVSVLDKSKMDWQGLKSSDVALQEELAAHARSDKQFLERQDFLKRAELREYELERDSRLASRR